MDILHKLENSGFSCVVNLILEKYEPLQDYLSDYKEKYLYYYIFKNLVNPKLLEIKDQIIEWSKQPHTVEKIENLLISNKNHFYGINDELLKLLDSQKIVENCNDLIWMRNDRKYCQRARINNTGTLPDIFLGTFLAMLGQITLTIMIEDITENSAACKIYASY